MSLTPAEVFPVDAVTRTDGSLRLRTLVKYPVIAVTKHQQLHLKIFEMVWVVTHYSFQLICNALHTAL